MRSNPIPPRLSMHRFILVALVAWGMSGDLFGQAFQQPLAAGIRCGGIEFRFATVAQGQAILGVDDDYVRNLSSFDRQVRTRSENDPGKEVFLQSAAREVIEWSEQDRMAIGKSLEWMDRPLSDLKLPKISPVMLVCTTGREESGAAYTRGAAIILPRGKAGSIQQPPTKLILHELFHVLSRADHPWRDRLYAIIGFQAIAGVDLPREVEERRISNPDGPRLVHVIRVLVGEEKQVFVAPVLLANSPFNPQRPSLFGYVEFKLMEVRQAAGERWIATTVDGEVVLHEPSLPDFHRQIGGNTGYIIHPDEILADNFVILVTGEKAKDQWLIDAMRAQF